MRNGIRGFSFQHFVNRLAWGAKHLSMRITSRTVEKKSLVAVRSHLTTKER